YAALHSFPTRRPSDLEPLQPPGLPEVEATRELADHHEVRPLDDRPLERGGVHEHWKALRRPQVGVEVQLLAQGEEPALGPPLVQIGRHTSELQSPSDL